MHEIAVHLVMGDVALRSTLAARIARAPGFSPTTQSGDFKDLDPDELVLTTAADCSLTQCGELTRGGVPVVLLSPVPRAFERANYVLVGARYLVMSVDTRELFTALREAAGAKSMRVTEGSPGC